MRKAGFIIGFIVASLWGAIFIGGAFSDQEPFTLESLILLMLVILNIASLVYALKSLRRGAYLLLASAVLFSIFALVTAGRSQLLALSVSGGPFLAAAILLILSSRKTKPVDTDKAK